jgi:GT2 family glycosyltransferase
MSISLVIIGQGNGEYLPRLLDSIKGQPDLKETILVCCGKDGDMALSQEAGGFDKVIRGKNISGGLPASCNRAAKEATGDYLVFAHDDVCFNEEFFSLLNAHARRFPERRIINCRVDYVDGSPSGQANLLWDMDRNDVRFNRFWTVFTDSLVTLFSCSECCFVAAKSLFAELSFSEEYESELFVEDYIMRAEEAGISTVYDYDLIVRHYSIEDHERAFCDNGDWLVFINRNRDLIYKRKQAEGLRSLYKSVERLRKTFDEELKAKENTILQQSQRIADYEKWLEELHGRVIYKMYNAIKGRKK